MNEAIEQLEWLKKEIKTGQISKEEIVQQITIAIHAIEGMNEPGIKDINMPHIGEKWDGAWIDGDDGY